MIDIKAIREVYPNYQEGQDISPNVLIRSMLVLQNQESQLVANLADASAQVDLAKLKLDRKQKEVDQLIETAMAILVNSGSINKDFLKNKELTAAYIKNVSSYKDEIKTLIEERNEIEDALIESKSLLKKYESMSYVVKNAINTAIQVLSYLKHEERLTHESSRI